MATAGADYLSLININLEAYVDDYEVNICPNGPTGTQLAVCQSCNVSSFPGGGTGTSQQCLEAVLVDIQTNTTCADIQEVVFGSTGPTAGQINSVCMVLQENISATTGQIVGTAAGSFATWTRDFAGPCISSACATSPTPIPPELAASYAKQEKEAFLNAVLNPLDRFIYHHGLLLGIVFLIILLIVIMLLCAQPY